MIAGSVILLAGCGVAERRPKSDRGAPETEARPSSNVNVGVAPPIVSKSGQGVITATDQGVSLRRPVEAGRGSSQMDQSDLINAAGKKSDEDKQLETSKED
jgi:hypothetical protein